MDVIERPGSKGKMPLDEATFQRLLAAAHVLQQHTDQTKSQPSTAGEAVPAGDPASIMDQAAVLAEIVETQQQILMGKLDLVGAMSLVAERICKLTGARGAAVGLLHGDKVVYRAASGSAQGLIGLELQAEATVSADTLLHGKLLRCTNIDSELRIDPQFARERGIQSFIAVPLFHESQVAGVMELLFPRTNAFQEQDVRTSQLMAGLLSEALARDAGERWRKDVAEERASMLEALEKIRPQLARLINVPDTPNGEPELEESEPAVTTPAVPAAFISLPPVPPAVTTEASAATVAGSHCGECGETLGDEEFFCPSCGTARPDEMQNQLTAALEGFAQTLPEHAADLAAASPPASLLASSEQAPAMKSDAFAETPPLPENLLAIPSLSSSGEPSPKEESAPETAPAEVSQAGDTDKLVPMAAEAVPSPPRRWGSYPWSSAQKAREWLRSLAGAQRRSALLQFWRSHGGDVSLGVAVTLVLATVVFLGLSSQDASAPGSTGNTAAASGSPPPSSAPVVRRRHQAAQPNLTVFEKLLVNMGLAEPPEIPSYQGNPDVTVWVDLQTALYYCPGSEMYGKTPKGKLETQHAAQMDQFEPAFRKVCE